MSDQKKLDEFLQQSFSDYSPDVPAHIWENIAAGKKKKRPVAFWLNKKNLLILGAMLVACGGAGLFIFQQNHSNNIALETNSNNRQQGAEKAVPPVVVKNNTGIAVENATATLPAENTTKTNSKVELAIEMTGNVNDKAKATVAVNNRVKRNAINTPVGNSRVVAGNTDTDNAGNDVIQNNNRARHRTGSKTTSSQTFAITDETTAGKEDNLAANNNDPLQEEFVIPALQDSKEKISPVSFAGLNKQHIAIKAIKVPDCPAAEKDAAGNKSYFEVYAGPDYAFKKYSDTGNSALIEKRKESLRFQSAFSAGVRYTKVFSNGMSIRAGINYSQINEKFSFIKDNVVQLVYVINTAGDTTASYYVRGTRYSNTYNHYRTIDVPLVVGYEMGNGRLHANINAGVVINVYSWQSGETLDNNYQPVNITTGKEGNANYQYKTNVGVGFTGAVSFYYKLNDRLHLLAEPYCRFNLSPMNKEAVSLQEKFTSIGLRLGLRVDF